MQQNKHAELNSYATTDDEQSKISLNKIIQEKDLQDQMQPQQIIDSSDEDKKKQKYFKNPDYQNQKDNQAQQQIDDNQDFDEDILFQIRDLDSEIVIDSRYDDNSENQFTIINNDTNIENSEIWGDFLNELDRIQYKIIDCCQTGKLQELKKLMENQDVKYPIDINKRSLDQWNALHYAVNEGHIEVVQYLLSKDIEINAKTSVEWTPLHISCLRGHCEICKILVKAGSDINSQDKDFNAPIHYASQYGHNEIVSLLLVAKANINLKNYQRNTPQDCSLDSDTFKIFEDFLNRQEQKNLLNDDFNNQGQNQNSQNSQNLEENYKRTEINGIILKNGRSDHVSKLLYLTKKKISQTNVQNNNNNLNDNSQQLNQDQQYKSALRTDQKSEEKKQEQLQQLNKFTNNKTWISKIEIFTYEKNQAQNYKHVGPDDFTILELLGKGAFGQVYLVKKKQTENFYAMKILNKEKFIEKNLVKYAQTERNVLKIMNHPFIVSLNYAFQTENKLYMVLDYCPGGDLNVMIENRLRLPEPVVKIYTCEIILALEALHNQCIIFRDLKPSNIVIDEEGHALLTDFGLSKEGVQQKIKTKSFCGSLAYLAPEMIERKGHGHTIDWYLLGVTIYEMLEGIPPFYVDNKAQLLQNIKTQPIKPPKKISNDLKSFLIQVMEKNPEKRLGAKRDAQEIKSHPYFKDIDWNEVYQRKLKPPKPKKANGYTNQIAFKEELKVTFSNNPQQQTGDAKNYIDNWSFRQSQI